MNQQYRREHGLNTVRGPRDQTIRSVVVRLLVNGDPVWAAFSADSMEAGTKEALNYLKRFPKARAPETDIMLCSRGADDHLVQSLMILHDGHKIPYSKILEVVGMVRVEDEWGGQSPDYSEVSQVKP